MVLCFVAALTLGSQSAASYPSYLLALAMLVRPRPWAGLFALPLMWGIAILLLYLLSSGLWSEGATLRSLFSITVRVLLVMLFVAAFAECRIRGGLLQPWFGRFVVLAGGLAAAAAILTLAIEPAVDSRLAGLGQLDNNVVAALTWGAVLILAISTLFRDTAPQWRLVAAISILILGTAVLLSGSRNGWISTALGSGILLITYGIRERRRFTWVALGSLLVLALLLAALVGNEATRPLIVPRGDSFRLLIWSSTFNSVVEHGIWFGRGILTNDSVSSAVVPASAAALFQHPHNMYLAVFFQGGVVGLVLFAWVVFLLLRTLLAHYHREDAKLALGLLGLALPAWLLDGHELIDKVGMSWFLFWLPVAFSLSLAWSDNLIKETDRRGRP